MGPVDHIGDISHGGDNRDFVPRWQQFHLGVKGGQSRTGNAVTGCQVAAQVPNDVLNVFRSTEDNNV